MRAFRASSSSLSPGWKSMARLALPSRLELKRPAGSFREAPLAKVIFTTFLYVSPVHISPLCDQTGVPLHFHSSATSGTASLIRARSRESISPLQSPSCSILASISSDGDSALFDGFLFMSPASVARLDHLPAVSRRVAEAGVHGAVAVHGLLRELHSQAAHPVVGGAAVVHDEHERWHRAFGHDLAQRLRRRRVVHRRPRHEQAELERWLVRVLHREPTIVTIAHIRVNAKPELLDGERERFVLISHVQTDHFDTLAHRTSFCSDPFISPASRRRFSETAIVRSGRCAALRTQAGTRPSSCAVALARARFAPGLSPVTSRKVRPNVPRLSQPVWKAISVMDRSVSRSSAVARSDQQLLPADADAQ